MTAPDSAATSWMRQGGRHPGDAEQPMLKAAGLKKHFPLKGSLFSRTKDTVHAVDDVLFGTGDAGHLRANIESLLKPPLPEADRERLASLFGHLVGVGMDAPRMQGN
jgi:hypothetical protein